MKTTIEIPDSLADRAKEVARIEGATLRELVVAGLRTEIERRTVAQAIDFHFPTVGGDGLVAELSPDEVIDRAYGFPS